MDTTDEVANKLPAFIVAWIVLAVAQVLCFTEHEPALWTGTVGWFGGIASVLLIQDLYRGVKRH